MAIRIKSLNRGDGKKTLAVSFGPDTLNLTYSRERYTPKLEREMQELMKDNLPGGMLSKFLLTLIEEWDVVEPHEEDLEKYVALEAESEKKKEELSVEDFKKKGIRFNPVPLTPETFEAIVSVEAQAKIVEALAQDQRPNEKSSDFTSDT